MEVFYRVEKSKEDGEIYYKVLETDMKTHKTRTMKKFREADWKEFYNTIRTFRDQEVREERGWST